MAEADQKVRRFYPALPSFFFPSGIFLNASFWLTAVAVFAMGGFSYQDFRNIKQSRAEIGQLYRILQSSGNLLSALKDAESSQRRYLLTGVDHDLEPYSKAIDKVHRTFDELKTTSYAYPRLHTTALLLHTPLDQRLRELADAIQVRRSNGLDAARKVVLTEQGLQTLEQLRTLVLTLEEQAHFLVVEHERNAGELQTAGLTRDLMAAGLVLSSLILTYFIFRRDAQVRAQIHHALRESEGRYRATFANAAIGIAHVGLDGRWLSFNDALCRITGYSSEELLTKTFADITHPDDVEPDWINARRLLNGEISSYRMDKRYWKKDGQLIWVELTVSLIRDSSGVPLHFISVIEDIDERVRTQNSLRLQTAQFETLLNQAPLGVYLVDEDLRFIQVNPVAETAFGNTMALRGRQLSAVMHELWPDPQAEEIVRIFKRTLLTGDQYVVPEWIHPRLDRGQIDCYEWRVDRILLLDGRYGVVCYFRNISDQIQARKSIAESEERFRTLADNISQLAWISDATGWLHWYNQRWFEYTGTTLEEMQGWGWENVHHPEHMDRVVVKWKEALHAAEAWEDVFPLRGRDGQYRWFLSRALPIKNDAGEVVRWFGTNTDITEQLEIQESLRKSEEKLRASAEHLEQLVGERTKELTHSQERLRALATELNLTEHRERQRLATELHDHLAQMLVLARLKLSQALQMNALPVGCHRLLNDIESVIMNSLNYARTLVAELAPPILREFGLIAALPWLAVQMRQYDLNVEVTLPEDDELLLPEEQAVLLFQSVRELLINVGKHAGVSEVWVALERSPGAVRIEVRDSGVGFDPSAITNLTLHNAAAGFGLFSIRERMLALGGRFHVVSAPGKGTKATLLLPLESQSVAVRPSGGRTGTTVEGDTPGPTLMQAHPNLQSECAIRVVLADDHAMVRQGLREVLENYKHIQIIGEAANGEEAIHLISECQPDIVLMDVNMPRMDGFEATRRIRDQFPSVGVIGLSIQTGEHVANAMREAGAVAFLNKEQAVEDLKRTIVDVWKKQKMRM